jgi:pilus assembly protein CpaF
VNAPATTSVDQVCSRVRGRRGDVEVLVDQEVRRVAPLASSAERAGITAAALARLRGLGELEELMQDPTVDEVLVNAGHEIWTERAGVLRRAGEVRGNDLLHLIERILAPIGRRVDATSPIVDARLPDGSRVCAVVPPVAVDGACLSIRRFAASVRSLADFTDDTGRLLCERLIRERHNIVVSGATSSGKTSLLASLVEIIGTHERIVVVEDTAELPIQSGHVVRLESRPASADGPVAVTLPELVRAALRLRPDRLVVGEVRGDEVIALVQALNTGHDGSLTTCHANGPLDALGRLETLVLQAAPTWPLSAVRRQMSRSIDIVLHLDRGSDGRRRIDSIAEVQPITEGSALEIRVIAESRGRTLTQLAQPRRGRGIAP